MYAMRKVRDKVQNIASPSTYYDPKFSAHAMKVLPGEYVVTDRDVMLVTVLGSCVSACIRDPLAKVGGMNHFMLPDLEHGGAANESARYGSYAMEMLINELLKHGASRSRLECKVFGGGAVLAGFTHSNVGKRNGDFVLRYLATEGLKVAAQDLYDTCPRRVHYFPMTGRVLVKHMASANDREVLASESLYRERLSESPTSGSVELF